jgi:hypothetical protein
VDLLVAADAFEPGVLLSRLEAAGLRPKHADPFVSLGSLRVLQLTYAPHDALLEMQVDLLLADSAYHRQALDRRINVVLPGADLEIAVLGCEDLILHKLLAGRLIDAADVAALLSRNGPSLDRSYLEKWLNELGLQSEFSAIWQQAFPDRQF